MQLLQSDVAYLLIQNDDCEVILADKILKLAGHWPVVNDNDYATDMSKNINIII